MPINYEVIAWEDNPSTKTPRNSANLNHMDNGIKAACGELDKTPYINKKLHGKKILVVGDSISNEIGVEVDNWVKYLRRNLLGTTIDNISFNGALLTGVGGQAYLYGANVTGTYDYIIVMLGVNDAYHQASLGTLSYTNVDYNIFSGSLGYLNSKILEKNPTAEVFFISPLKNNYDNTNKIFVDVYRSYIFHACNMFGWHFIDGGSDAPLLEPMITSNKTMWISDGIHPNPTYAPYLGDFILQNILKSGSNKIGIRQSVMDASSFLTSGYTGLTAKILFRTDGTSSIFATGSISMGAGVTINLMQGLPAFLSSTNVALGSLVYNDGTNNITDTCYVNGSGNLFILPSKTATAIITLRIDISISNIMELINKSY